MLRTMMVAVLAIGLVALPVGRAADDEKCVAATAEKIVATLCTSQIEYEKDLKTTPFLEVLEDLSKRHNVRFVVNARAFAENGDTIGEAKAAKLLATRIDGVSLHRFLTLYLASLEISGKAAYLVRDDHIEITTREEAQREAGLIEAVTAAGQSEAPDALTRAEARMNLPLVSVAVKDKPLATAVDDLARTYGLNVIFESSARPLAEKTRLTERLLNVPADTALELLASQAELTVVRKGNTFRITANAGQ